MKTSRRSALKLCLLGVPATATAGALEEGEPILDNGNILARVISFLETKKLDGLTNEVYKDGGLLYSYYLRQIVFIGRCPTIAGHRNLIYCQYIRSSPYLTGPAPHPGRGHGYLLCFTDILHLEFYHIVESELEDFHLEGSTLTISKNKLDLKSDRDFQSFREGGWF